MFDRTKPTVGCSANGRSVEVGQTNDDVAGMENITICEAITEIQYDEMGGMCD